MSQHYSDPKRASDPHALPDVETFYVSAREGSEPRYRANHYAWTAERDPGWYWWACFPGCLPDGEPVGPFRTEDEAVRDAQEGE